MSVSQIGDTGEKDSLNYGLKSVCLSTNYANAEIWAGGARPLVHYYMTVISHDGHVTHHWVFPQQRN